MRKRHLPLLIVATISLAVLAPRIGAQPQPAPSLDTDAVMRHLNAVIDWYRGASRLQNPGQPSDEIYQSNSKTLAGQVVKLAFQSAKAEAMLLPEPVELGNSAASASAQRIQTFRDNLSARMSALEAQITSLNAQIAKAPKSKLKDLQSERDGLNGELGLDRTVMESVQQFAQASETNLEEGHTGFAGRIAQLEQTVPELATAKAQATTTSAPSNASGLIGSASSLYGLLQSMGQVDQLRQQAVRLRADVVALRTPLQAMMRTTIQQGQDMANQLTQAPTSPANASPNTPTPSGPALPAASSRQQFSALSTRFKQIAAANLPLQQEIATLDQSSANFQEWHDALELESGRLLRSILFRVVTIAIAIGFVLLLSEMWRRITFRYIHDLRRRRQFLILRRVVVGFCMGLVLILGFVSEFSSLATFAGFITAGIAVGLQTILLSVAAYFFLVGRWGIRVGDRISVAGVTGDVVDVGLVRMYLMELAGTGIDLHPTGRVVVFSNSVLFQATTPLFKQIPGTQFTWHEVALLLQPNGDYKAVESKLLEAVDLVYKSYRDDLVRQHGDVERKIEIRLAPPEPNGRLQYGDSGLECVVRYPVSLDHLAQVDDEITHKVLELLKQPDMQSAITGPPKIRAAIKQ